MLLLTPFKQKCVDFVLHNQRLNFFLKFMRYLVQKSIYEENFKTDCEENNQPIFAPKVSNEA